MAERRENAPAFHLAADAVISTRLSHWGNIQEPVRAHMSASRLAGLKKQRPSNFSDRCQSVIFGYG